VNTCGYCGWLFPQKTGRPCAHVIVPVGIPCEVPRAAVLSKWDGDTGHDSMASVMSWPTRRWPTFHDPEESENIVAGRNAHLADVARRYPRVQDWGRHADPSKGLPLYGIRGDDCDCGVLHLQPADIWAWARLHARELLWDDTDRRGSMPASRRSGADASGTIGVGVVNPVHRRWRMRAKKDPLDALAIRAFHRRRRAAAWGPLPKLQPKPPRPRRLPRFRPSMLSDIRNKKDECTPKEKWEIDQILAGIDEQQRETPWMTSRKEADERGWATPASTHQADKLNASRRALEWVNADLEAYVEHHLDAEAVEKLDGEHMLEVACTALYARVPEAIPVIRALIDPGNPKEHLETTLARIAKAANFTTAYTRGMIATDLQAIRSVLEPWGRGRTDEGLGAPDFIVGGADRRAVLALARDADRMEPKVGRPPAYDPGTVFWALQMADRIVCLLTALVVATLAGEAREPVPNCHVAFNVQMATQRAVDEVRCWLRDRANQFGAPIPAIPTREEVAEAVLDVPRGRRTTLLSVTRRVAAAAYGVPYSALVAMVKKAKQ
jgi:hypothetical protein